MFLSKYLVITDFPTPGYPRNQKVVEESPVIHFVNGCDVDNQTQVCGYGSITLSKTAL
jgi:hypothetical protein